MRAMVLAVVIGHLLVVPAWAQVKGRTACPANAVAASFVIWPKGTLPRYKFVQAMHPCGRAIQCEGSYTQSGSRRCSWN